MSGELATVTVRPRPRIEGLADLIFGLALSVGSLALVSSLPKTTGELFADIATFGFTFVILISVWFDYTRILSVMPVEERRTNSLNTLLLFTVSLEPFLFILVNSQSDLTGFFRVVSQVYALDLGIMMGVLAAFSASVAYDASIPIDRATREGFRRESVTRAMVSLVFFVSIVPVFGDPQFFVFGEPIRIYLWIVPLVFALGLRRWRPSFPDQGRRRARPPRPQPIGRHAPDATEAT